MRTSGMLEILFLGTSAGMPSRQRMTSSIAVRDGRDVVLMDCGEGVQRQLMLSPFSFMKIKVVLITHMHGDHFFGLAPLLQTMGMSGRNDPLTVIGPPGMIAGLEAMMGATDGVVTYPLELVESSGWDSYTVGTLRVETYPTDHGVPSIGFVVRGRDLPGRLDKEKAVSLGITRGPDFARLKSGETVNGVTPDQVIGPTVKGLSVSYTGDTRACDSVAKASEGVDVLIHECTYGADDAAHAEEHNHSTSVQAAETASKAGVRHLILTHMSNRYDDRSILSAEARSVFPCTDHADDMMLFEVTAKYVVSRNLNKFQQVGVGDHADDSPRL